MNTMNRWHVKGATPEKTPTTFQRVGASSDSRSRDFGRAVLVCQDCQRSVRLDGVLLDLVHRHGRVLDPLVADRSDGRPDDGCPRGGSLRVIRAAPHCVSTLVITRFMWRFRLHDQLGS